jgi:alkylation response protein AidB-like acyl-CoA dehydrogenase
MSTTQQRRSSSLANGFFQSLPILPAQYTDPRSHKKASASNATSISDDPAIPRLIALYLPVPVPSVTKHLHDFSRLVILPQTLEHTVDADTNPPTLHTLTTFGTPNLATPLQTSPGWRELKRIETANGVVGHGYHSQSSQNTPYNLRIHQFLTLHIWAGSSAVTMCPMAMTDGAATLLRSVLSSSPSLPAPTRKTFSDVFDRLTSTDPNYAWTSGQWMTERSGGSDVRGTETIARKLTPDELRDDESLHGSGEDGIGNPLGEWRIDGFKWFSSATDADCAVLLAQTQNGLSVFWAPLRRLISSTSPVASTAGAQENNPTIMNGVYLSRLKSKLGTKAVPTAELEIRGMRAYLLGQEAQGTKLISTVLNVTRLWTASDSVGCWSRGLAISRAFTRVRQTQGKSLAENQQHVRWLAEETVWYRAMSGLYMFGVALLGHAEHENASAGTKAEQLGILPATKDAEKLLRILTPVIKTRCSLRSVEGLRNCMESLGGVGYCENNEDNGILNIARLFRDVNVHPIWEGTVSVLAEDLLRALKVSNKIQMKNELEVFGRWVQTTTSKLREVTLDLVVYDTIEDVNRNFSLLMDLLTKKPQAELLWKGRDVLERIGAIVCTILLIADAAVDSDEVAKAVAVRYARAKLIATADNEEDDDFEKETEMDRRIFLGERAKRTTDKESKL